MQTRNAFALALVGAVVGAAGCRHTNSVDKMTFKATINDYLSAHQECVWADAKKFPAQADTSNDEQTKGYDALTDAGLLTRKSAEKKRFLIGSKQVNDYDLSDKGRTTWTADPSQPGYGNFCYGHREVTTVDSYTPADNPDATVYSVSYHYELAGVPDWAKTAEMQTAFPKIAPDTSGQQAAVANLSKTSNGWQVNNLDPAGAKASLPDWHGPEKVGGHKGRSRMYPNSLLLSWMFKIR